MSERSTGLETRSHPTLERRTISDMSRMLGAVTPRLRFALAIMVGSAVALLMPSLLATTVDTSSAVVLAALLMAVATAVGLNNRVATLLARALAPPPRTADQVPALLAGRVADPVHHPLRPRAPGLA
jgi:hypothetical protein